MATKFLTSEDGVTWDFEDTFESENDAIKAHIYVNQLNAGDVFFIANLSPTAGKRKQLVNKKKIQVYQNELIVHKQMYH